MPDSFVRNLKPVNWVGLWEEPAPQFPEPLLNYWLVTCEKRPSVWAADGHSDDLDLVITAIASQWKDKLSPLSIAFVSRTELNARGLKVEQVPESVPGVPDAEDRHFEIPVADEHEVREVLTIIHSGGPPRSLTKDEVVRAAERTLDRGQVRLDDCHGQLRKKLEEYSKSAPVGPRPRPERPATAGEQ